MLGHHLVHAADAGRDPGPGVGDAEDLQQLLGGAVLTARAVHGDEGDVGPLGAQLLDQVGADVERQDLVAESPQRVLDPSAGAQRDAALERATALEDGDLHASPALRKGSTSARSSATVAGGATVGCSPVNAP